MSRPLRFLLVSTLALFILACNLISNPINDVGNAASTAKAFASEMPFETLQALSTAVPIQTLEALPSAFPEVNNYLNPTGAPVDQWNGIPVMPEATLGEEFSESVYSYTAPVSATDVQTFYNQNMEELGWTSAFGFQVSVQGGILSYTKEGEFVIITISPDQDDRNSVDVILQK